MQALRVGRDEERRPEMTRSQRKCFRRGRCLSIQANNELLPTQPPLLAPALTGGPRTSCSGPTPGMRAGGGGSRETDTGRGVLIRSFPRLVVPGSAGASVKA